MNAAFEIMVFSFDVQRYEKATEYGEIAYALVQEKFPQRTKQIDEVGNWLINVYFTIGKQSEAHRIIDKNIALNDLALDDAWIKTPNGLRHRFTGLYCPNKIGDLWRDQSLLFRADGSDVGCNYRIFSEDRNDVTIYLTRTDRPDDSKSEHHQSAIRAVEMNWSGADKISDEKRADFKGAGEHNVLETIYQSKRSPTISTYTGAWTSVINDWVLKSRVTWNGNLGHKFGADNAKELFEIAPKDVEKHLNACIDARPSENKSKPVNGPGSLMSLLSLTSDSFSVTPRPELGCLSVATDNDEIIVEYHLDSPRLFTLFGSVVTSDIFVQKNSLGGLSSEISPSHFLIRTIEKTETTQNETQVLAAYVSRPSPEQVLLDFVDIYQNEKPILGSISVDSDGNSNININSENLK